MSLDICNTLIAYGTNFGKTQGIATALGQEFEIEVLSLDKVTSAKLSSISLLIVICASFANGYVARSAVNFYQNISSSAIDLSHLKLIFLSVGSHKYPDFCCGGKLLYEALIQHKAELIYPYAEVDLYRPKEFQEALAKLTDQIAEALNIENVAKDVNLVITKTDRPALNIPPSGYMYIQLLDRQIISAPDYTPRYIKYTFDLSNPIYKPGDHFLILSRDDESSQIAMQRLNIDPKTVYQVQDTEQFIPNYQSAYNLFGQFLDCTNQEDDLNEILKKPRKPQAFSVANSKGNVEFLIQSTGGPTTTFLEKAPIGSMVALQYQKGIYVPTDKPMILIALGSGFAPVRSIYYDRKEKNLQTIVFYGVRTRNAVKELWPELEKEGIKVAISREEKKQHVPDLMKEDPELLWSFWKEPGAQVYICGPPTGIDKIVQTYLNEIAQAHGITNLSQFNSERKIIREVF